MMEIWSSTDLTPGDDEAARSADLRSDHHALTLPSSVHLAINNDPNGFRLEFCAPLKSMLDALLDVGSRGARRDLNVI